MHPKANVVHRFQQGLHCTVLYSNYTNCWSIQLFHHNAPEHRLPLCHHLRWGKAAGVNKHIISLWNVLLSSVFQELELYGLERWNGQAVRNKTLLDLGVLRYMLFCVCVCVLCTWESWPDPSRSLLLHPIALPDWYSFYGNNKGTQRVEETRSSRRSEKVVGQGDSRTKHEGPVSMTAPVG